MKILNESENQQKNQKTVFGFPLDIFYFASMAGGTSAFNMIQSFRDNMALKKSRRKMLENPYLGSKRDLLAEKITLDDGINHRFDRKKKLQHIRIFSILGIMVGILIVLLIFKIF